MKSTPCRVSFANPKTLRIHPFAQAAYSAWCAAPRLAPLLPVALSAPVLCVRTDAGFAAFGGFAALDAGFSLDRQVWIAVFQERDLTEEAIREIAFAQIAALPGYQLARDFGPAAWRAAVVKDLPNDLSRLWFGRCGLSVSAAARLLDRSRDLVSPVRLEVE